MCVPRSKEHIQATKKKAAIAGKRSGSPAFDCRHCGGTVAGNRADAGTMGVTMN
jgi:hypothetical protein